MIAAGANLLFFLIGEPAMKLELREPLEAAALLPLSYFVMVTYLRFFDGEAAICFVGEAIPELLFLDYGCNTFAKRSRCCVYFEGSQSGINDVFSIVLAFARYSWSVQRNISHGIN